jgi:outer membrane murein-binding lipoprotein Lpp
MTTVNDITDILRIIREQPEWADALRAALLSKDVLELPQRLAEYAQATNQRLGTLETDVADLKAGQARLEIDVADLKAGQARLEIDVADLKAGQARLEGGQSRLEGDVGNIKGAIYEQKVGNNIASIVGQHMGLRRVRVLKGYKTSDDMGFHNLVDSAEEEGFITERERVEVGNSDIVIQGYNRQSMVYVALEVSVTVGESDIDRAATRAEILSRATREESVPAVVGAYLDDSRQQLAQEKKVALIPVSE